ncbi:MAG: hypothetical protein ISN28_08250 [Ectothiorhodospiraceae bacterium AqS1]|nr:hypothetical protein [Ectothiorhodospiraceae bacterium AqS1]
MSENADTERSDVSVVQAIGETTEAVKALTETIRKAEAERKKVRRSLFIITILILFGIVLPLWWPTSTTSVVNGYCANIKSEASSKSSIPTQDAHFLVLCAILSEVD